MSSLNATKHDIPLVPNVAEVLKLDPSKGEIELMEVQAAKVWRVVNEEGRLMWGDFHTGVAHNLPLGSQENVPVQYHNLIRIQGSETSGYAKFIHRIGSQETEITFSTWPVNVKILADVKRTGEISEVSGLESNRWIWGKEGIGAVVMPNKDRDAVEPNLLPGVSELVSLEVPPITNSPQLEGYAARLSVDPNLAQRISVYQKVDDQLVLVLGKDRTSPSAVSKHVSDPIDWNGGKFFLEAHEFPGISFNGIISLDVSFIDEKSSPSKIMANDTVILRVSPWIMTSHTLPVETVYVTKFNPAIGDIDGQGNIPFLNGLKKILSELGIPLHVVTKELHQGDRWIQDEFEIGYTQDATHSIDIVFDGPRNRGLDDFPETLLGPNFGHFAINGMNVNSLDSFGNLEVSPPVTVNGHNYPFGRIIYGGPDRRKPMEPGDRQMMGKVRSFLGAQLVQDPIEIFSDWLLVGHVDEFMSFIPDSSEKGFKMLLASPTKTKELLQSWKEKGYGNEILFEGLKRNEPGEPSAEISINDLLADESLWKYNDYCQDCLDYNQKLLSDKLGLTPQDIIEVPVMFKNLNGRAAAYFPDMVNQLVLNNVSIVPKPYGAIINGKCIFEREFEKLLPNRKVYYLNDWYSYHELLGEVHCGTNVTRTPSELKWWEHRPKGAINI